MQRRRRVLLKRRHWGSFNWAGQDWSWSWAGQGRTGQDNSARGSKSRCEGCRMQPGGDCMGFERNEDSRKRGQVSRYPGV